MDEEVLISNVVDRRTEERPGFRHKAIHGMSIAVIVLGVSTFIVGAVTLVLVLLMECEYRPYQSDTNRYSSDNYYRYGYSTTTTTTTTPNIERRRCIQWYATYSSPGIWSGLTFIACGIIGVLAAKRKTTCFIVALMTMSVVSNWVAACAMILSFRANFDRGYYQINSYPVYLHVLNSIVTAACLACFVLHWVKFGMTCHAVCCDGKKGYPKMKETHSHQYQPLPTHPMLYGAPPQAPQVFPACNLPPAKSSKPEPVYLVQGHRIIGIVPNNAVPETAATAQGPSSLQNM